MALTDSLSNYWKLDEASGNFADSVGSITMTAVANVGYGAGKIGNCAVCSGNTRISSATTAGSGDFTVSYWLYLNSAQSCIPIGKDNVVTRCWSTEIGASNNNFYGWQSNGDIKGLNYPSAISASTWHHIVIVYNYSGDARMRAYLDGSEIGTAQTLTMGAKTTSLPVDIGFLNNNGTPQSYLNGKVDEVGIWSRALSAAEVSSLYNGGSGLTYPFSTSARKLINGLAVASVKSYNGLATASVKSKNGLA